MESFGNQTRIVTIDDRANAAPFVSAAKAIGDAVADAESRAFDGFLALVPGVVAAPVVQVTRVHQGTNAIAFLIQSPEALDWRRIDLKVQRLDLKTTKFVDAGIKVLRKADGAGLMIVSAGSTPSGSLFPQADYRLVFTYRRDNRAVDKDSDVLSEAGNTSPEVVTLNSPWGMDKTPVKFVQLKELLVPA